MVNPFLPSTSGLQPNAGLLGTPGAIVATSITSLAIATGSLSFIVQPQCVFAAGMPVFIVDSANTSNWMWGTVTSYNATTGALVINVQQTAGSGTIATWDISLSGVPGATGAAGSTGATGAAGSNAGPVIGAVQRLQLFNNTSTPNTKITIETFGTMMTNSSGQSQVGGGVINIDLTTGTSSAAANGMDGEARGTGWVYLYLINNGTTTAGLATKTTPFSGDPTLPSGYTYLCYVGAMLLDGSGNLYRSMQFGNKSQYVAVSATNTAALPTLISGTSGNVSTPTYTSQAISGAAPATTSHIDLILYSATGTAAVAPNNSYGVPASNTTNPPPLSHIGQNQSSHVKLMLESGNIYYVSNDASAVLFCLGWEDFCVTA